MRAADARKARRGGDGVSASSDASKGADSRSGSEGAEAVAAEEGEEEEWGQAVEDRRRRAAQAARRERERLLRMGLHPAAVKQLEAGVGLVTAEHTDAARKTEQARIRAVRRREAKAYRQQAAARALLLMDGTVAPLRQRSTSEGGALSCGGSPDGDGDGGGALLLTDGAAAATPPPPQSQLLAAEPRLLLADAHAAVGMTPAVAMSPAAAAPMGVATSVRPMAASGSLDDSVAVYRRASSSLGGPVPVAGRPTPATATAPAVGGTLVTSAQPADSERAASTTAIVVPQREAEGDALSRPSTAGSAATHTGTGGDGGPSEAVVRYSRMVSGRRHNER
jgi:hypothetical protein